MCKICLSGFINVLLFYIWQWLRNSVQIHTENALVKGQRIQEVVAKPCDDA